MESPLSFDSTENFRKKLLLRNLKPYNVDGSFSSNYVPANTEFTIIDYSIVDSPTVESIGNKQEPILYKQNKYGPQNQNATYGDPININVNLNTQTNFGEYDFSDSINSKLENIGNNQENLLYVKNLYGPTQFGTSYGDTIQINTTLFANSNLGGYGYPLSVGSKLEIIGNVKENDLIVKNVYKPNILNGFGDTVWSINNDLNISTNGSGEYNITDTFNSNLYQIGNSQEIILRVKNKYTPEGGNDYGDTYNVNQVLTIGSNEGEYGYPDTIGNQLEGEGVLIRPTLFTKNEYRPENNQSQYVVEPFSIVKNIIIGSGNYTYADSINSDLWVEGKTDRPILFSKNQYGPQQTNYRDSVFINRNLQTRANEGEYGYPDTIGSTLQVIGKDSLDQLTLNSYRPETNILNTIFPNRNLPTVPNRGIYNYNDTINSELVVVGNSKEEQAYIKNKYVTGTGSYEVLTIDDIPIKTVGTAYANGLKTLGFVYSTYSPINILKDDDPKGSNGSLSQDSDLANIGAKQLQKEFKSRINLETLQQTVGRVNALTSSIDPDSGEVSVKPNLDPFNAVGIISGNIPVLARNFKITSPSGLVGKVIDFTGRLAGLYSPYSIIPGEYFDYPNKRLLNQLVENPVQPLVKGVFNGIRGLLGLKKEGSELLLNNTSQATKSLLYEQLFYNEYRPDYKTNFGLNLFAPKPNYYIGNAQIGIEDLVAPVNEQANDKNGNPSGRAVLSYSNLGKQYEGDQITNLYTGFKTKPYYDGESGIQGGVTWLPENDNFTKKYQFVGPGGKTVNTLGQNLGVDNTFYQSKVFGNQFDATQSYINTFTPGSILDITQKIIDAGANSNYKLEHVGTAINQISKVFNDGYVELTKGSRVIRYTTRTSTPSAGTNEVVGYEYCRLFTKDRPYMTYDELQKTDGNIRKFSNSVLDNTYNLNIAPIRGNESTNIQGGKVKKYMFSLENLAWRTSNRPGFTYEDLPDCEKGPNGGRIMWFPPYDLTYDESVSTTWTDHTFLGRTEPIYTFSNSKRTGNVSFKIVVDNPSITNLLVEKELEKVGNSEATKVINSFFAGCLKYDIYDLAKRYRQFTLKDIFDTVSYLDDEEIEKLVAELPNPDPNANPNVNTAPAALTASTATTAVTQFNIIEPIMFFENDYPDPKTTLKVSTKNYKDLFDEYKNSKSSYQTGAMNKIIKYNDPTYTDYVSTITTLPNYSTQEWLKQYIDTRSNSLGEFFDYAQTEFTQLQTFLTEVGKSLKQGDTITFSLIGSASAIAGDTYNVNLSTRRINSVIQYIETYDYEGEKLKKYIDSKKLIITQTPKGENETIQDPKYKFINCSEEFLNKKIEGVKSINAMACRRVRVSNIVRTAGSTQPPQTEEEKTKENEGSLPAKDQNEIDSPPQTKFVKVIEKRRVQKKKTQVRQDLTKRLLRKLLTECNYFELIRQSDPMIYDGIKEQIKHFNPAFHSMTPEGLNARLVFLQQCMRPGDTIPTVSETDSGGQTLIYNDVTNSVFGAPPICVLRVGDFFHTKIAIDSLTLKYDDVPFDLNPEGIGVQPMIATVSLGFSFIGGHGLAEPIAKLQNALSFNYYANTEMYDERAEATEDATSKYDAEILKSIKDELGVIDNVNRPLSNDGGVTIGTATSSNIDGETGGVTGDINYKEVMKDLTVKTKAYVDSTVNSLTKVNDKYGLGGLSILNKDRKFTLGYFNYLSGDTSNEATIYGKSENMQPKVDTLFTKVKEDIDNETSPIFKNLNSQNLNNSDTKKIKTKLKSMVDALKQVYVSDLEIANSTITKDELPLIKLIDQLNYVSNQNDGYINQKGGALVYGITGGTEVDYSSTNTNTLDELITDFLKVKTNINEFYGNIATSFLYSATTYTYNDDFSFNVGLTVDGTSPTPEDNRFYMVFGNSILTDANKFINDVTEPVTNTNSENSWKDYISTNVGWSLTSNSAKSSGLYPSYKTSKENSTKPIGEFKDGYYKTYFALYNPFNLEKTRKMTYSKILTPTDDQQNNLKDIYNTRNSLWDKFNLKKSLN